MKILLYSVNFAPEPVGIGKYSGEMAAWWVAQGHQVRVVAAPPYYPAWKIGESYAWPLYRREQWQGVDIWRAPLWVPRQPGGLTRVLHLLTFALSSLPVMFWQVMWRPDVVMTVAPALVCAPAGWLVAKLGGGKAWLHIQDFEVDLAFQMGLLRGKVLQTWVSRMERWLLLRFDAVSSISNRMLERLQFKGVPPEKIRFFPNWVDIGHISPLTGPSVYRSDLGIKPDVTVALFSGTLGNKQGLLTIPEAAHHLAGRADILFVICGDGAMKPQLEAAARQLSNLLLLPLQPFERLGELLGLADIHLLTQSQEAEDLVLPSKLTGMLASGRPVVATCREDTELGAIVSQFGLTIAPNESVALANAIERLADDPQERRRLGALARLYAENNLSRDAVLGQMVEHMQADFTEPSHATAAR